MSSNPPYKGYTIEPTPRVTPEGRWVPHAVITLYLGGGETQKIPLHSGTGIDFATQAEANAYAMKLGQAWIDRSG